MIIKSVSAATAARKCVRQRPSRSSADGLRRNESGFFPAVFLLLGSPAALAAVGAVGGIAGGIAGEGEELPAGFALPFDVPQFTRPLLHFLFLCELLLAVLAESGHIAPGGIDGKRLPAFFTGFLPEGSSSITDISRSPYNIQASVLGMGVALITNTFGRSSDDLSSSALL